MVGVAVSVLLFVGSLALLLKASDLFTSATERIGLSMGVSPFIVGATVVAGGTSLPELVSSVLAVGQGAPEIVVGNVVGSNVANIFVVLGIAGVVGERIRVERELMRVDLPILVVSAAFVLVAVWNSPFVWYEGVLALLGLVVYVHFTLSQPERLDETVVDLVETYAETELEELRPAEETLREEAGETEAGGRTYLWLLIGLVLVFVSADQLVRSILAIASTLGIGADFVAITAVGVGTSVPEIAVTVTAVRGDNPEIAVGNVLGSNVFNSFAVMGVSSLVAPLSIPTNVRDFSLPVMVLATVLYYFITQDREITRWEGAVLFLMYVVFLVNLVQLA